jgi:c-di-GMP-binding flagellar brake protein YcgR
MKNAAHDTLRDAIARNAGAILSLPHGRTLRHHKTRFLADADDSCFWIEAAPGIGPDVERAIEAKTLVGIAFKSPRHKIVFATGIVGLDGRFRTSDDGVTLEAIRLRFPAEVKTVVRRSHYRVRVPPGAEVSVRAWRIPDHAVLRDRPPASMELSCKMRDVSAGGMCVVVSAGASEAAKLGADQRLRIIVKNGESEILLDGRVRHVVLTPEQTLRAGVQFKMDPASLECRQTLTKLNAVVAELTRAEAKRARMMAKAG